MLLMGLRKEIIKRGLQLKEYGLITLTGGNISGRDPKTGYIAITPSGMEYEKLQPQDIVVVDINGKIKEGDRKPSSDLPTHLQIYGAKERINGVIHTHSTYASCFAVINESIPVITTTMANVIGGEVPVAKYAPVQSRVLGENILEKIKNQNAVLMESHGVMTFGKDVNHALKAAVMVEEAAKVYYLSRTLGQPVLLPKEEVKKAYDLYMNDYGQGKDK